MEREAQTIGVISEPVMEELFLRVALMRAARHRKESFLIQIIVSRAVKRSSDPYHTHANCNIESH